MDPWLKEITESTPQDRDTRPRLVPEYADPESFAARTSGAATARNVRTALEGTYDDKTFAGKVARLVGKMLLGSPNPPTILDKEGKETVNPAYAMDVAMGFGPGILAGPRALNAPRAAMAQADKFLEWRGSAPTPHQVLWRRFGVAPGKEGKMRYEIPDDLAHINPEFPGVGEGKLKEILRHPALYEAYPTIGELPVMASLVGNAGSGGYFKTPRGSFIEAAGKDPRELLRVLLHESQHGVQDLEKFAGGGSPAAIAQKLTKRDIDRYLQKERDRIVKAGMKPDEAFYHIEDFVSPNAAQEIAFDRYHRRAGEVEARNVERRWAEPELRKFAPALSEDVPRRFQLLTEKD